MCANRRRRQRPDLREPTAEAEAEAAAACMMRLASLCEPRGCWYASWTGTSHEAPGGVCQFVFLLCVSAGAVGPDNVRTLRFFLSFGIILGSQKGLLGVVGELRLIRLFRRRSPVCVLLLLLVVEEGGRR